MWIEGNLVSSTPGDIVDMFDVELVKNAQWEIFDDDAGCSTTSLVTNGDFSAGNTGWTVGANWSTAGAVATHSPGSTAALSQAITLKSGFYYTVSFTVTATASTVSLTHTSLTGALGAVGAGNYSYVGLASATSVTLTFTPNTLFNGTVDDVSVVQYCAANHSKVYHCQGTSGINCDFYVKVENEHTNFAVIELWEGWDVSTHTGVGSSATVMDGSALYIFKFWIRSGAYKISLHDNSFTFITSNYHGYFVGRPDLYDDTKNVVMIVHGGVTEADPNPLSYWQNSSGAGWHFLFDGDGNNCDAGYALGSYSTSNQRFKGIDGKYYCFEAPVHSSTTGLVQGVIPGYVYVGNYTNGFLNGDLVTIDGVDWIAIFGTPGGATAAYGLVRKD